MRVTRHGWFAARAHFGLPKSKRFCHAALVYGSFASCNVCSLLPFTHPQAIGLLATRQSHANRCSIQMHGFVSPKPALCGAEVASDPSPKHEHPFTTKLNLPCAWPGRLLMAESGLTVHDRRLLVFATQVSLMPHMTVLSWAIEHSRSFMHV